ncbi:PA3496 family putative envelope integrity protein [Pistricoccus aurantiacus]|nr:hypothetical protein [Pistricoccus aurantiacus]
MGRDYSLNDSTNDEQDYDAAVNDDDYTTPVRTGSRADTLRARRQVEHWLEERRLKRHIEDSWLLDDEEEE